MSHVSEEMGSEELRFRDERFPLTVAARADKQRGLTSAQVALTES